jgi:hypothetical protein
MGLMLLKVLVFVVNVLVLVAKKGQGMANLPPECSGFSGVCRPSNELQCKT